MDYLTYIYECHNVLTYFYTGNWLKFGAQVRIKHLLSRKYLSVEYINHLPSQVRKESTCSF